MALFQRFLGCFGRLNQLTVPRSSLDRLPSNLEYCPSHCLFRTAPAGYACLLLRAPVSPQMSVAYLSNSGDKEKSRDSVASLWYQLGACSSVSAICSVGYSLSLPSVGICRPTLSMQWSMDGGRIQGGAAQVRKTLLCSCRYAACMRMHTHRQHLHLCVDIHR